MREKSKKRVPGIHRKAAVEAQRRMRAALATTLARPTAGPTRDAEALPRAVVRAQRRLEAARQKAIAAAEKVESEAYDALSVVVRTLKIPMADAGALLGYPYISVELLDDGRWTADIPALPGLVVHAKTRDEALAKIEAQALRAVADEVESGQQEAPGVLRDFERRLRERIDREKQASRDADARDRASGRKTAQDLCRENGLFHGGRYRIDYTKSRNPR